MYAVSVPIHPSLIGRMWVNPSATFNGVPRDHRNFIAVIVV